VLKTLLDQTHGSARRRVAFHLPERAPELLKGRVRIMKCASFPFGDLYRLTVSSIWRPLFTPLESNPLALYDFRSIQAADLVTSDLPSPQYEGEIDHLYYNVAHEWWFIDRISIDQAIIIKYYDSATEDRLVSLQCVFGSYLTK
jgi:hypothetical protein